MEACNNLGKNTQFLNTFPEFYNVDPTINYEGADVPVGEDDFGFFVYQSYATIYQFARDLCSGTGIFDTTASYYAYYADPGEWAGGDIPVDSPCLDECIYGSLLSNRGRKPECPSRSVPRPVSS